MDSESLPQNSVADEKGLPQHSELYEKAHDAAERGHVATDRYDNESNASVISLANQYLRHGHSLVQFDPKAEARLRLKIDLYIVPTVALLYLFCFIDRANIGRNIFFTS
jgi:hypothetical protein